MDIPATPDRWLSAEEVAVYIGISKDTVYAWIAKKGIPAQSGLFGGEDA